MLYEEFALRGHKIANFKTLLVCQLTSHEIRKENFFLMVNDGFRNLRSLSVMGGKIILSAVMYLATHFVGACTSTIEARGGVASEPSMFISVSAVMLSSKVTVSHLQVLMNGKLCFDRVLLSRS